MTKLQWPQPDTGNFILFSVAPDRPVSVLSYEGFLLYVALLKRRNLKYFKEYFYLPGDGFDEFSILRLFRCYFEYTSVEKSLLRKSMKDMHVHWKRFHQNCN